jgi:NADH-quinone oxidoreductase subunit H
VLNWPWPIINVGNLINSGVFVFKAWLLVFVMMWVRWTLPRLRIDQVMMTCLQYLLPISCFLLLGVTVWEVYVRPYVIGSSGEPYFAWALFAFCFLVTAWLAFKIVTTASRLPTPSVAAPWAPVVPTERSPASTAK